MEIDGVKYYSWQCPNCQEWLQDPMEIKSTMCHCGQSVWLGDLTDVDTRYVLAKENL